VEGFNVRYGLGSPEGLQKIIEEKGGGLLLVFDEFKAFVDKAKIQNSVMLPAISTLFESNIYENATKTSHICIKNAHVSLLAASTIETYEAIYSNAFIAIGFPNRVFIVTGTAEKQYAVPPQLPQKDNEVLKKNLLEVMSHVVDGLQLSLSPDADEIYRQWYLCIEDSIHAKRLDTYALRLMQLLAVNDLKTVIDQECVEKAIALCNWQLDVRKRHDPIDAENVIANMEEKIRRQLERGPMKERDLKSKVNYKAKGIWVWDTAKKNLEKAGEIWCDKSNKLWTLAEVL
jgi:hypothetical protein